MPLPIATVANGPQNAALIRTLGHLSLLPFVGMALLLWLLNTDLQIWVGIALASYGALVVSFLGGIHWGMGWLSGQRQTANAPSPIDPVATTASNLQRHHMLWGVVPPLMAWPGILMPAFAGLAWMGFLLVICYLADRTLYTRAGLQQWLNLRFRLTAVAALSCFIGAGAL